MFLSLYLHQVVGTVTELFSVHTAYYIIVHDSNAFECSTREFFAVMKITLLFLSLLDDMV